MSMGGFGIGRSIIGIAVAVSLCGGAPAQDVAAPGDAANAMIGVWEFSNADRDKLCRFVFRPDVVPGGHKLEIDKNCASLFPATKDVTAWTLDNYGSLHLVDPGGNVAIELVLAEAGIYDGFEPTQGRYVLQIASAMPVRSAEDMAGEWGIARGSGKPICMITLANTPAGANDLPLKLKPGCDAAVVRFGPSAWRMDHGELVLLSARGQSWRFEENDANTWQRVPDSPDPFLLVRQ